jgi:hypothetical protein
MHKLLEPIANEKIRVAYERDRDALCEFFQNYLLTKGKVEYGIGVLFYSPYTRYKRYARAGPCMTVVNVHNMYSIRLLEFCDGKRKPVFGIVWHRGKIGTGFLDTRKLLGIRLDETHWQADMLKWLNYFMDERRWRYAASLEVPVI